MSSNSTERATRASKPLQNAVLSILISLIAVGGALGGFLIGRNITSDAYVAKVADLLALESNVMSLYTYYQMVGTRIENPTIGRALARLYGVTPDDPEALAQALRSAAAEPPYRTAPFIGSMARPVLGD